MICDLRRRFSRLTTRSFFLSDLSGVLNGKSGTRPRQTVGASLHPLNLPSFRHLVEQKIGRISVPQVRRHYDFRHRQSFMSIFQCS
jgi:hypothetical protein